MALRRGQDNRHTPRRIRQADCTGGLREILQHRLRQDDNRVLRRRPLGLHLPPAQHEAGREAQPRHRRGGLRLHRKPRRQELVRAVPGQPRLRIRPDPDPAAYPDILQRGGKRRQDDAPLLHRGLREGRHSGRGLRALGRKRLDMLPEHARRRKESPARSGGERHGESMQRPALPDSRKDRHGQGSRGRTL